MNTKRLPNQFAAHPPKSHSLQLSDLGITPKVFILGAVPPHNALKEALKIHNMVFDSSKIRSVYSWVDEEADIYQEVENKILPQMAVEEPETIVVVVPQMSIVATALAVLLSQRNLTVVYLQYLHKMGVCASFEFTP